MKTDTITYLNDAIDIVVNHYSLTTKILRTKIFKNLSHLVFVGCGKFGVQQAKNILADWRS